MSNSTANWAVRDQGYDDSVLPNIDFVDAGLCALTARAFSDDRGQSFGDKHEGIIVVPRMRGGNALAPVQGSM